jgi:virulence factor Mce-like protein
MRRILATFALLAGLAAFVVVAGGAGGNDSEKGKYWVELDNAFGLIQGGDLKVAGVRAGKITELKLDRRTKHALVGIKINENGFGSLRTDVKCESRPQSLIGEYFIDCLPGTAKKELKAGSTIPVSHTASTVGPDLVNNILRRPYRERLSIILSELGAGVAGNADNLNAAIRRASPALRETDKVLHRLGNQNQVLADLVTNGDKVIGDLAANHRDVGRWIKEARDTAQASAERRADIARGFARLPEFLRQLRGTMAALGRTADAQTPSLRNLNASADQLDELFNRLKPFADASRPAFRSLGQASDTGRKALASAQPTIAQLNEFAKGTPELGKNLAIILEHLNDRSHAVEKDPRAPNGEGYTGLEALLTYVYDQALSTNVFDSSHHYLKVSVYHSPCADYADIEHAKKLKECTAALGPNLAGINFPDQTNDGSGEARSTHRRARSKRIDGDAPPDSAPQGNEPAPAQDQPQQAPQKQDNKPATPNVPLPDVPPITPPKLPDVLPGPGLPKVDLPGGLTNRTVADDRAKNEQLLDYLLRP